jgi:hypothetical protein
MLVLLPLLLISVAPDMPARATPLHSAYTGAVYCRHSKRMSATTVAAQKRGQLVDMLNG